MPGCKYLCLFLHVSSIDHASKADSHMAVSLLLLELEQGFSTCKHRQLAWMDVEKEI
jgi:hypothetical protein